MFKQFSRRITLGKVQGTTGTGSKTRKSRCIANLQCRKHATFSCQWLRLELPVVQDSYTEDRSPEEVYYFRYRIQRQKNIFSTVAIGLRFEREDRNRSPNYRGNQILPNIVTVKMGNICTLYVKQFNMEHLLA